MSALASPAKSPMVLVHLHGQGDSDMKLVPPCVLTWLTLPYSPPAKGLNHYNETIPEEVAKVFDALCPSSAPHSHVRVSIGSCSNDRALAIPGPHFNSMLALIEHVQKNAIPVVDEFEGHLY